MALATLERGLDRPGGEVGVLRGYFGVAVLEPALDPPSRDVVSAGREVIVRL